MAIVKINALQVPPVAGPELERRFEERNAAIAKVPGFLGYQLLRPTAGEDRYFVVTQWVDEDAYQQWLAGRAPRPADAPALTFTGSDIMEFDVVMDIAPENA